MGTIADKLEYLNDTKTEIKEAIVNKGQSIADTDTFRSYADKINKIVVSKTQSKTQTISSNTTTTIKPDSGYTGLSQVTVTTNVPLQQASTCKRVWSSGYSDGWKPNNTGTITGLPGRPCVIFLNASSHHGWAPFPFTVTSGERYIKINGQTATSLHTSQPNTDVSFSQAYIKLTTTATSVSVEWNTYNDYFIEAYCIY